jgi:hypothetical protein
MAPDQPPLLPFFQNVPPPVLTDLSPLSETSQPAPAPVRSPGRSLEMPLPNESDEQGDERDTLAGELAFFSTEPAADYARHHSGDPAVSAVFGFARALASGYAFLSRPAAGITCFTGYENTFTVDPGTMLLDATADLDGIVQICPWRIPHPAPRARYDNLHIVCVPSCVPKNQRLKNYLATPKNSRTYSRWLTDLIKTHMKKGERGLVVCKLDLITNENVPDWPADDDRRNNKATYTEKYGWNVAGRKLCVTNWGGGIGSNTWQQADVVFLLDEFWIPRRQIIATAQGLLGHKAAEGPLKTLKDYNSRNPTIDALAEGHLLRWQKQLALRGRGRQFDEHGVCGHQKLVTSMDRTRLLSNLDRLFPGACIELAAAEVNAPKQSAAEKLLAILGRAGLRNILTTRWISQEIGKPWREVWKHISGEQDVQRAIANLGWRYVPRPGRPREGELGSTFERLPAAKAQSGALGGTAFRPSAPLPQFPNPLDIMLGVAGRAEGIASGAGSMVQATAAQSPPQ